MIFSTTCPACPTLLQLIGSDVHKILPSSFANETTSNETRKAVLLLLAALGAKDQ